jgi:hypothetical protein
MEEDRGMFQHNKRAHVATDFSNATGNTPQGVVSEIPAKPQIASFKPRQRVNDTATEAFQS